jgi:ATP-dependent RNA helicase RhlE
MPAILAGRDVLGLAQTGTGKTAAFVLPILEHIMVKRSDGPRALIIAPTRELVQQIQGEIETLARGARVKSVTVYGGVRQEPQVRGLRARPDIIVACPGRLLDLFGQGAVDLSRIEILVLDEADYMFDMGFLPDVRRILKALPKERQNLMFSATMPPEIRNLTEEVLVAPFNQRAADGHRPHAGRHRVRLGRGRRARLGGGGRGGAGTPRRAEGGGEPYPRGNRAGDVHGDPRAARGRGDHGERVRRIRRAQCR